MSEQPIAIDTTPRQASGALTKTGGFLRGFTHTLQPYIGCRFGCEYCYVKGLSVHRFHQPALAWGGYVHPRVGIAQKLRGELQRLAAKGLLEQSAIFMSSATDPYQGAERRWRLSRACLDAFVEYPPGLLIVQTRSPLVEDDFARLRGLGERCWLNFTLETDDDRVRRVVTPDCPAIARRLVTLQRARTAGINVQITVSPCLPYSTVEGFGTLLLEHGQRVIIDTYASGDGQQGKRTAATGIPALYAHHGWASWRAEAEAQALFAWLQPHFGERVGWSQQGFAALAEQVTKVTHQAISN